jgi:BRCT domain, a BRCA1 C-terminus domain
VFVVLALRSAIESGKKQLLQNLSVCVRGSQTNPPVPELLSLVTQCGGELVTRLSDCDVCIAGRHANRPKLHGKPVVSTAWLLDSISEYCLKPTASYAFDYYRA